MVPRGIPQSAHLFEPVAATPCGSAAKQTIYIDVYFRIYYYGARKWENGYKTRTEIDRTSPLM